MQSTWIHPQILVSVEGTDAHYCFKEKTIDIRLRSLEPTANAFPSGDHLQQRAARLIFNNTRVGIHFPSSKFHTYALQSSEQDKMRL